MANNSCSFTSINDLFGQAEAGQLNITTIVSSCPGICSLAWGTGSPDLSGIGTNISYILQAILTILFGPLFCCVYAFRERWNRTNGRLEKIRNDRTFLDVLKELHDAFLDVSAQFNIPVAIAAIIRFRKHAPIYELAFLRSLTTMQFLSLLSTAITTGVFETRKHHLRITIIVLYSLIEFGFYMGLIGGLQNEASWETIHALSDACKEYGDILPYILLPHITAKQFFNSLRDRGKFAGIIAGFLVAGLLALCLVACIIVALHNRSPKDQQQKVPARSLNHRQRELLVGLMSLAFTIGMLVELVQMERTRNDMKSVTGAEFQDNQWGFGQIISLFLWVPLCIQIVFYGIEFVFGTPIKPADPESADDSEKPEVAESGLDSIGAVNYD